MSNARAARQGPGGSLGLFALAMALASCSVCDAVVGGETRVRSALAAMESGFTVPVPGGPAVEIRRASFREATVARDSDGWFAATLVDADGACGATKLAYLGVEKVRFAPGTGAWKPRGPALADLAGVVAALRGRAEALAARDLAAYRDRLVATTFSSSGLDRAGYLARLAVDFDAARMRPPLRLAASAWTVRIDRGQAQVLEEFSLAEGDRPVAAGRARFTLAPEGDGWRFASGLD